MCEYGVRSSVGGPEMVESVRTALGEIRGPVGELLVSPSGSMLDPLEVPVASRDRIFGLMGKISDAAVCVETRPETVTEESASALARAFAGRRISVEMGLESSSPWVLRFCVNKGAGPGAFTAASDVLADLGLRRYANVALGAAFLSPLEAVEDTSASVRWALRRGVDRVLIFPLHVKRRTLLGWLFQRGRYSPPSLWSLVDVLGRLDPDQLPRVGVSWYRSIAFQDPEVLASPTTCELCAPSVLDALDRYRAQPCAGTFADLSAIDCACRSTWRSEMASPAHSALAERVFAEYMLLAEEFRLLEWWRIHGDRLWEAIFSGPC